MATILSNITLNHSLAKSTEAVQLRPLRYREKKLEPHEQIVHSVNHTLNTNSNTERTEGHGVLL